MDGDDFEELVAVALHMADQGDGSLEPDEVRPLLATMSHIGGHFGLKHSEAIQRALAASSSYLQDPARRDRHEMQRRFEARIQGLAQHHDPRDLARIYADITTIATSDGEIELGEKHILHQIRDAWRLQSGIQA